MRLNAEQRLTLSLGITVFIFAAEVVGGFLSNSLALLSDAGHVLTDSFALVLSVVAARIGRRPSDHRATYGYRRFGLLAAIINGAALVVISAYIFIEAYHRFISPPDIETGILLSVAGFGLAGNIVMALIIGRGHDDLNIESAWLHVLGDTLSSVGVIISGLVLYLTGWKFADPLVSIVIGLVIVAGGIRVMREALIIFLDLVPRGFNVEELASTLCGMPDVLGVHDVHVRSIAHNVVSFSAHIWVHDQKLSEVEQLRRKIEAELESRGLHHILLQFECAECEKNGIYCQVRSGEPEHPHGHDHRH